MVKPWKSEILAQLTEAGDQLREAEEAAVLLDSVGELSERDRIELDKTKVTIGSLLKAAKSISD